MSRFGRNVGSVLQDWVTPLPLRYQGVLVSSVRGCDADTRDGKSKAVTRAYRGYILNTPAEKPSSFFEFITIKAFKYRWYEMLKDCDHLPHHFVLHLIHAVQIVGCEHPDPDIREGMFSCYHEACRRLHLNVETSKQLEDRLTCNEEAFKENQ